MVSNNYIHVFDKFSLKIKYQVSLMTSLQVMS